MPLATRLAVTKPLRNFRRGILSPSVSRFARTAQDAQVRDATAYLLGDWELPPVFKYLRTWIELRTDRRGVDGAFARFVDIGDAFPVPNAGIEFLRSQPAVAAPKDFTGM